MKRIIGVLICMLLLLAGCSHKEESNPKKPEPAPKEEEVTEVDERCIETLEKAAYIQLGDIVEDSYRESMGCELEQEDIEALKKLKNKLVMTDKPIVSFYYYKLSIYDKDKNLLDTWTVDVNYRIEAGLGYGIEGEGKLEELLKSVEEKNGITFEKVCSRVPGENYLQMLDKGSDINLVEITENNFIEGIDYYLEQEDIEALKKIKEDIEFGETQKEFDIYHYQIHIYTESGAELYFWVVDYDGKIYSQDYEMGGEALEQWQSVIEKKSGLSEKRKKWNNK